ncbi:MFS transporter [Myroides sp. 1354]|uniref:MFS transporter n=1 Tax=unclassified Myroides TaxID=2642485 RepID=UPI0025782BB1|nr:MULTISPECIES: MFS transporter [unclassified Myroides]MDM1044977.1 MFS transporter [Myroides sp. R163-1]MDM1055690.1 MFS transporter [Myroides sp. 1354]MDM1068987.1 MFS transporter [Myroides sp. 1372]
METTSTVPFSRYEKFVIFILAITQFTVILDFMVMAPLGDLLLKSLAMDTQDFGIAVSAYAFSAGASGLLTAGFADKFDRKKLLLFFYIGFIVGTLFCGLAYSYETLVAARIFTGLFGGVIGSISMAIITDIFSLQQRGRVMGFVQMGFGASQVLGIPIGLYIANKWFWEAPFFLIVALSIVIALLIGFYLRPVNAHLALQQDHKPLMHLWNTLKNKEYRIGFVATTFLSVGGFMMMPFGTIFAVNNLGVHPDQLPLLFMVSGVTSLIFMPFIGKLSDKMNKYLLFSIASIWLMLVCVVYTNMAQIPLWLVMVINILMMFGIMSRMVPSSALTSAVPEGQDRGAFMSINSSIQQIAGGIAAAIAGLIVYQEHKNSPLMNYDIVGYVVVAVSCLSIVLMYRVNQLIKTKR